MWYFNQSFALQVQIWSQGHPGCTFTVASCSGCWGATPSPSLSSSAIVPSMTRPTCPPIQWPGGG